jgi:Tol biopolymer transport system component
MVRELSNHRPSRAKATLVVAIGGLAVVWHILACVDSPMAFSPSGDRLAFVVHEDFGGSDMLIRDRQAFRLMILDKSRHLATLETSCDHMLSAPGFSPDGERLCYVRIPLLAESELAELKFEIQSRRKQMEFRDDFTWLPAGEPATQPAASQPSPRDLTLPPLEPISAITRTIRVTPPAPAELVVRNAATGGIITTTRFDLPLDPEGNAAQFTYLLTRPQYSPDGKWVYFAAGQLLFAINPETGDRRVLGSPAYQASLSPDGRLLWLVSGGPEQEGEMVFGFIRTDGQSATYCRWPKSTSLSGTAWVDRDTLAVLELKKEGEQSWLHLLRPDGSIRRSVPFSLDLKEINNDRNPGELAVAPNGRYAVIALVNDVYFVQTSGKLLRHWHDENLVLASPTFSPDSKTVAFKRFGSKDASGCDGILFFTPEGKQTEAVAVPPSPPEATRPS